MANYGSAMAPVFTNLTLWVGAFMLVVLIKLNVDSEGIGAITHTQAYMGRWLLMAAISAVQAIVVTHRRPDPRCTARKCGAVLPGNNPYWLGLSVYYLCAQCILPAYW